MSNSKSIRQALISVFDKDKLEPVLELLDKNSVEIISTGGTKDFIEEKGYKVKAVEEITDYPSILGGRVKTLHPKIFGGILYRRENEEDLSQIGQYQIPSIDLIVVDLYPFEKTVDSGADEQSIIEKIDIGGISLIRAAAKNFKDTLVVPSKAHYEDLIQLLEQNGAESNLAERKKFAMQAFQVSSHYDTAIFNYFNNDFNASYFKQSFDEGRALRYGENPHQEGYFYGKLDDLFEQLHGKQISYNNLLDIDAALGLIAEFKETTFAILKHNNACGIASRDTILEAWKDALAGDPVSAFGGILITNTKVTAEAAKEINRIFFEVIIAPSYEEQAMEMLKSKKNRIILIQKPCDLPEKQYRSILNGVLVQDKDYKMEVAADLKPATDEEPTPQEVEDLLFANKVVKHSKSNTIVLAKNKQLCASGVGQTSRVDALKQAIEKAKRFNFNLKGAVMSSDAFFPFADSVEIAHEAGITAVIQPGGSVRDKDSIDFCNEHKMKMVFTGTRHFKH